MPIYEYTCNACNIIFETLVISSTDRDNVQCVRCKGMDVKKILSTTSPQITKSGGAPATCPTGCKAKSGFT